MATKKLLLVISVFLSLCAACITAQEKQIDQLFTLYSGNNPGATVMIVRDGKPIFQKAYGMAQLEKNIPVELHTNFRLASVSKQFTAMCIMMLMERGLLTYDQKVVTIFDDFPDYGENITIQFHMNYVM